MQVIFEITDMNASSKVSTIASINLSSAKLPERRKTKQFLWKHFMIFQACNIKIFKYTIKGFFCLAKTMAVKLKQCMKWNQTGNSWRVRSVYTIPAWAEVLMKMGDFFLFHTWGTYKIGVPFWIFSWAKISYYELILFSPLSLLVSSMPVADRGGL